MPDDNSNVDIDLDDNGSGGAAPAKGKKRIAGLLPSLLKWIAIGLGAVILIVVIVIVTMTIRDKNKPQTTEIPMSEEFSVNREVLDWYTSLGVVKTRTSDEIPATVVVDVALGYTHEDKRTSTEITERNIELCDFLRRYFTQKTIAELKPQNEQNLKIELRNAINDEILSSSKIKDVAFKQLDVIEQ